MSDDVFEFDLNDLTIGEIELIEEKTGKPFDSLGSPDALKGTMMRAIAWITKRRDDPDFTWEQAGDLKIQLSEDEPDPTDGADS